MGLLLLLMAGSRKLLNRLEKLFNNAKVVGGTIIFTLLSFVFALLYSMVAIVSSNIVINALLCAVFLVFSWFIVEKMYQLISGEGTDIKDENKKILTKKDKNLCNLAALIAMLVSSIMLYIKNENIDYIILMSIAISIWIGAYIPISEIYQGTGLKNIVGIVAEEFKSEKATVWVTAGLSLLFILFFVSGNAVAQKLNLVIEEIGKGMAIGSLVMILGLVFLGIVNKKQ